LCFTLSKVGIACGILGAFIYLMISRRKGCKVAALALIPIVFFTVIILNKTGKLPVNRLSVVRSVRNMEDFKAFMNEEANGRFAEWGRIWETFTSEYEKRLQTVTGFGAGSYEMFYPVIRKNRWGDAHNDTLEMTFNFGIAGILILFMAVKHRFKELMKIRNEQTGVLLCGLLTLYLCSLFSFPFKIPTTLFYGVVIIGLLHNNSIGGNHVKT